MQQLTLNVKKRSKTGKKVKYLRKKNFIPAILYGHNIENIPLYVDYSDFVKIYKKASESTIINLKIDDKDIKKVLVKDMQLDPVTDKIIHIDFYQVRMTEKITAEVELKFIGKSSAVEEKEGILVKNMNKVKVECLPADLPSEIKVDISSLKEFDDVIKIKDLSVPKNVEVKEDKEKVVSTVTPPRTEEELKALEEKVEEKVEEVEGIKEEVKEDEESKDGKESDTREGAETSKEEKVE